MRLQSFILFLVSVTHSFRFSRIRSIRPTLLRLSDEDDDFGPSSDADFEEPTDDDEEQQLKVTIAPRKTLERSTLDDDDFYDDDPLRSNSPLVPYDADIDQFANWYLAVGHIDSQKMLEARKEAWLHHLQWLRRTSLAPQPLVGIKFEYTRLSNDLMFPGGQVIGMRANGIQDIQTLLANEPLQLNHGIQPWQIYKMDISKAVNMTLDIYDPYIFIGILDKSMKKEKKIKAQEAHYQYHKLSKKVTMFGILRSADEIVRVPKPPLYDDGCNNAPLDNTNPDEVVYDYDSNEVGICIIFNCKSNADALKYISSDPMFGIKGFKETHLSPINIQDINGLHLAMPRSFAEKQQLDQIHYMNPEDLLRIETAYLKNLPNKDYYYENQQVLSAIMDAGIDYNYTRINVEEKLNSDDLRNWNNDMALWQKLRIRSSQMRENIGGGGGDDDMMMDSEDMGGDSILSEE